MKDRRIRVLCVDDHSIVREGIALIIDREPDMRVVASIASGEEAVDAYRGARPDVTLMDLQLAGISGIEAIQRLRVEDPAARIIVLTVLQGDEDIHRALKAGAMTYLLKDTLSHDLVDAIREVHAGRRPIGRDVEARLAERAANPTLTDREVQIVELLSKGMRNREIAASLGITERTAEVHVRNILEKLHAKDRTAAVSAAVRRGIVHLR
jgi:two-component system NarL family response regulator